MDARIVANYLTQLKEKSGLTYEAIAEKSGRSVSTVKNLCLGRSEDPRLDTVAPVVYAVDGSIDEMYTGKSKDELKEFSIASIKEMYEFQLSEKAKTEEAHISNIRAHYEQHREDYKENVEKRFADKREIIEQQKEHIATLKSELRSSKILAAIGYGILIALLILEVANPELGWLRF
jgi:transcriptional regulator with XRE-family HTH domain